MKDRKLASRYARALLAALPEERSAEQVDQFLAALREAMTESIELRELMMDPAAPRKARESVLVALAQQQGMPPQLRNFLRTVVDHNRTGSLPSIATVFHEEREAAAGIVPAEITTAVPHSSDLNDRARRALEQATGKRIRLTARIDPALLGGAVTRVGSVVYDGSLRTQLTQLRKKMVQE